MAFKRKMQRRKVKVFCGTSKIRYYWSEWQIWRREHPHGSIDRFLTGNDGSGWFTKALRKEKKAGGKRG